MEAATPHPHDSVCPGPAHPACSDEEAAAMAAAVWAAMWPVQRIRQREFFEFGMEVRWASRAVVRCAVMCCPGL